MPPRPPRGRGQGARGGRAPPSAEGKKSDEEMLLPPRAKTRAADAHEKSFGGGARLHTNPAHSPPLRTHLYRPRHTPRHTRRRGVGWRARQNSHPSLPLAKVCVPFSARRAAPRALAPRAPSCPTQRARQGHAARSPCAGPVPPPLLSPCPCIVRPLPTTVGTAN